MKDYYKWRQDFHSYPELGTKLHLTSVKVIDLLESFGLEVAKNIGVTGVVATLRRGQSTRTIALRADMDALAIDEKNTFSYKSKHDGKMHACGHDGHTSMLLLAARVLSQSNDFDGTVHFIFQPDEEHGTGAQAMIDDGLFDRFPTDLVFGMHNMPGVPSGNFAIKSGPIMAAEDSFSIKIIGTGGHASQPHRGIDPIVIGAEIVLALQTIVSRVLDPSEAAVVSVTNFVTNGTTNVLASHVHITGDCRTFSEDSQDKIAEKMSAIVKGLCQAHGAEYEFDYSKLFYPTVNNHQATQDAISAAITTSGKSQVDGQCKALTISEDFSSMLRVKPGAYIFIGNGVSGHHGKMLHNANYDFNDDIIEIGAKYWVTLVKQKLNLG